MSFKLIDDVSNLDGGVAIVTHAVGRAGSRGNVIRLAGMGHAEPKLEAAALMKGAFELPISVSKPVFSIMMTKTC